MKDDVEFRIGIDMGGTKTESILLQHGKEIFRKRIPTPKEEGYEAIVRDISNLIDETAAQCQHATLGMGIPGIIHNGTVINANTTIMIGHPLKKDLEDRLQRPIAIENDANCFTMAEAMAGAGRNYDSIFGIIMGTGCGGGIFIDNKIRTGKHGIAGEWGHFSIDPEGMQCWCGNKGCIETKISGSGMEKSFEQRFGRKVSMKEIIEGRHTDPEFRLAFADFLDDFGRALGGLISVLDPDAIVIGGGLSNISDLYTIGKEKIEKYAFHQKLETPVLQNQLGDSAGVFGAAWIGI